MYYTTIILPVFAKLFKKCYIKMWEKYFFKNFLLFLLCQVQSTVSVESE